MAALLMLPVLLLAGVAQATVLYRCSMDGQVRKACCCPQAQQPVTRPAASLPVIARTRCCDTEVRLQPAPAPATQNLDTRDDAVAAATPVASALVVIATAPSWHLLRATRAIAPQPPRIPIVLLKSSLLI